MCRNIKPLFNLDLPASQDEIRAAAVQYVRKVSGFNKPSKVNEAAFDAAVDAITRASAELLNALKTSAAPRNREVERSQARTRARRYPV
jgi:hypothetical protein